MVNMHCTQEYDNYGLPVICNRYSVAAADTTTAGNPQRDKYACCFGPTTEGVGFPQGRYFATAADPGPSVGNDGIDTRRIITVSTSEYAKYAYYYLPESDYVGTVTGILSMYCDNGGYACSPSDWAITPRNVMVPSNNCLIDDICLYKNGVETIDNKWLPVEWSAEEDQDE